MLSVVPKTTLDEIPSVVPAAAEPSDSHLTDWFSGICESAGPPHRAGEVSHSPFDRLGPRVSQAMLFDPSNAVLPEG